MFQKDMQALRGGTSPGVTLRRHQLETGRKLGPRVTNLYADSWRPSPRSSAILGVTASTISRDLKRHGAIEAQVCLLSGTDWPLTVATSCSSREPSIERVIFRTLPWAALGPSERQSDTCAARWNLFSFLYRSLCFPQADETVAYHTYPFLGVALPMASAALEIGFPLLGKGFEGFQPVFRVEKLCIVCTLKDQSLWKRHLKAIIHCCLGGRQRQGRLA